MGFRVSICSSIPSFPAANRIGGPAGSAGILLCYSVVHDIDGSILHYTSIQYVIFVAFMLLEDAAILILGVVRVTVVGI